MRPKVNRGRVYVVGVVAIVTVEWRCWSGATFSDSGIELYFGGILTAKERMPDIAAQPEVSNAHDIAAIITWPRHIFVRAFRPRGVMDGCVCVVINQRSSKSQDSACGCN